ncbi:Ger(x)C family spore germination protein [Salipaludibacillus aurantiacus]|uniref:Germination protein, Ger(X)C family n=1 Tax=Salipaludibacillus aurantiacus TaxID=1601833 RepID=A0A1H9RJ19_9BACI|nr:Ger(x)C family spore germination protein [Salipaludibacillus aurantiacus]SER71939.1 germination protein, Ger(x)C family [Salipaludibacillus aurantiacus]
MKVVLTALVIFIVVLNTGCWDSRQLRDITVVKSAGYDTDDEEQQIEVTFSSPIPEKYRTTERAQIVSALGHTPRNARDNLEAEVSETLDLSKLRVLMIGEELASNDLYPPLDVLYRDPRSALAAKLVIVEDKAKDLVDLRLEDRPRTSELIAELIKAAEEKTMLPITNIQLICPPLFDRGQDAMIPYLTVEEGSPHLAGVALFNDKQMTGTLSERETTMLLLMMDQLQQTASLTEKVHSDRENELENYVTIDVEEVNRNLDVTVNQATGQIEVPLKLGLFVNVIEYPLDDLDNEEKLNELSALLADNFTEKFQELTEKLKESNSDIIGIGRRIHAFHYPFWKEIEWKEVYPEVDFQVEVTVEIVRHGIIS